jgi:predicted amidohydrolase
MPLDGFKEKLFQQYLIWICRPARLKRHLRTVLPHAPRAPLPDKPGRRKIRAAALQLELKLFKNPLDYADAMHHHVQKAAVEEAQIVVFPEYNNLPLLGLLPGIEKMEESYLGQEKNGDQEGDAGGDISLAEVFRYMSPIVQPLIDTVFASLAAAYGLYIMAGSYTLADRGGVVNRAFLYGPDGKLIGSQDKVHLLPVEAEWNLKRGRSFNVYKTAVGNLALPICMDATYYETFRILEQENAEIVLLPIANQEAYNYWLALRGIWPRVQESVLYGVKSAHVGSIAGLIFSGRAGIFAPLELTPNGDGVLAEVEPNDCEAIAVADLDLDALHELRREHPWRDSNPALYNRYPYESIQ